jgi:hypothetical protein
MSTTREQVTCSECGSWRVNADAYVDATTHEVVGVFDDFFCEDCDGECSTTVITVDENAEPPEHDEEEQP